MADLIINGKDAYETWGVRLGDKCLDALGAPVPMKEYIENKSRLEHGKRVLTTNPRLDEREVTLTFTLEGESPSDYQSKKAAFYAELYKGEVSLEVPETGSEVYRLVYLGKSVSYARSMDGSFGKVSAKFCEYNPANRSAE